MRPKARSSTEDRAFLLVAYILANPSPVCSHYSEIASNCVGVAYVSRRLLDVLVLVDDVTFANEDSRFACPAIKMTGIT